MTKQLKEYAVIFTYNFDEESEITLFGDDYDGAKQYLKETFEEEYRVETEENGQNAEQYINDNGTYAEIRTHTACGFDICEYRLCTDVKRRGKQ